MSWDDRILNKTDGRWQEAKLPRHSMEVVEVYTGSIAEAAGIKPGMLYLTVEKDKSAQEWTAITARGATGKLVSRFIDPASNTTRTIETLGFPWGMRLEQPNHHFVDEVLSTYVNPTRLAGTLLDGTNTAFQDITDAALARAKRPSVKQLLIKAVMKSFGRGAELDAVIRFQKAVAAIAAARKGDAKLARRLMPQLDDVLMHDFGTGAGAVCLLAEASVAKAEGRPRQEIARWLQDAFQLQPTRKRLADALTENGVPAVAKGTHTVARPFGIDYKLPIADALDGALRQVELSDRPHTRLSDCLTNLGPDQLGVVIMLDGYRVNGPYSWLIENLGHLYPLLAPRLPFVHVISSLEAVTNPDAVNLWKTGEVYARSRGVPVMVLHDGNDTVYHSLSINSSPVMYLLTREGTILYQGCCNDDEPFWDAFERLDGMRKAERKRT